METRKILLAIVIGLLGADLIYMLGAPAEQGRPKPPPTPTYKIGQELETDITLVSTDARALACASDEEIDGRHCEFESSAPPKRWGKPLSKELPPNQAVLAPYKTTDEVMFLVPGLFSEPALVERLKVDPPSFGQEHIRFTAHCKMKIVGKMAKFDTRWQPNGQWYPASNVYVGTVSGCSVIVQ